MNPQDNLVEPVDDVRVAETLPEGHDGAVGKLEVPGRPQGRWFLPALVIAWFGVNMALVTPVGAAIPKVLQYYRPGSKETESGLILGIGGLVVIAITPLFGMLSDRTMSRHGMRRPWMAWGVVVGLAGTFLIAFTHELWLMILAWCLVQIGFGATNVAQHALLADQIPTRIRARVSAAVSVAAGLSMIIGVTIVAVLPQQPSGQALWFTVPGLIGGAMSLALVWGLKDIVRTTPAPPLRLRTIVGGYWLDPRTHRDFFWAWVCRFLVTVALVAVQVYIFFFLIDVLGVAQEKASGVQAQAILIFSITGFISSVVCGIWSDRVGKRKPIIWWSCLLSTGGLAAVVLLPAEIGPYMAAIALVGAGQGAYVSVDVALMTDVLPSYDDAGRDLGIVALSYQVPQVAAPMLAVPVLAIGAGRNYDALYLSAAALVLLGGLAVLPIRSVD